jgi:hypothetical protein
MFDDKFYHILPAEIETWKNLLDAPLRPAKVACPNGGEIHGCPP